jgi:energy-coupling factor transport system ATP-binding protein
MGGMPASIQTRQALLARGLSFAYPPVGEEEPRPVLDGLDFTLAEGATGVLLGAADAGKTTFCRLCANLVPRFTGGVVSGVLERGGAGARALKPYDCVESLGLVFQDPDEQTFTTRCDTEVAFALESLGVERGAMESRVRSALAAMGLRALAGRNPATLSGGEKKRLLIACLLAADPPFWILDEVFQELDAEWRAVLLDRVEAGGKTALFLDSRWSPLYAPRCARPVVLERGRAWEAPAAAEAREAMLQGRGLVLPPLDRTPVRRAGEPFIRAEGVTFGFGGPGGFTLDVDGLELGRGTVCALVGRNGSGKSTLGKLLCGLLEPREGRVSVRDGAGYRPASRGELNRSVGYLFQNPDYQVFLPTVEDELSFGLKAAGETRERTAERVVEARRLFNLPHGGMPPALMSYGARKRLQAATFHLLGRKLLILDEIDAGLSYGEFLPLIDLLASGGAGVVFITHDMQLAERIADRVIVMESGRVASDSRGAAGGGAVGAG